MGSINKIALILAAGIGSRMGSITKGKPKSMLEIGGRPLLENHFQNLLANGFQEVNVVVGFKKDEIISYFGSHYGDIKINYTELVEYRSVGHSFSLWYGLSQMRNSTSDIALIHADVFCDSTIYRKLAECEDAVSSLLFIDPNYQIVTHDECLATGTNGFINKIGFSLAEDNVLGEYMGLGHLRRTTVNDIINNFPFYFDTNGKESSYEIVLSHFIEQSFWDPIGYVLIDGKWVNVNYESDFNEANLIAGGR